MSSEKNAGADDVDSSSPSVSSTSHTCDATSAFTYRDEVCIYKGVQRSNQSLQALDATSKPPDETAQRFSYTSKPIDAA